MNAQTQEGEPSVVQQLPVIIRHDPAVQNSILKVSQQHFADKQETESRFDRVMDELQRDREEQARKWEEQNRKWEENQRELRRLREEQNRRWEENLREIRELREEQARKWEEQDRKWEEQSRKWEEQDRKWRENQDTINAILSEIQKLSRKHDSTIGALGARWGLYTEQSFRNALRSILEESFGIKVLNVTEFDDEGEVFGRPDQIELDVIIQNGTLILCEIKSSMSKSDMYTFERKVRFYEKRHNRKADRIIVISPMVDPRAWEAARKLGIEVYSYAEDVNPEVFS